MSFRVQALCWLWRCLTWWTKSGKQLILWLPSAALCNGSVTEHLLESDKTNHPRLSSKSTPVLGYLLLIWHLNSYIRTRLSWRSQFSCPFSQQTPAIKEQRSTLHTEPAGRQKITGTVLTRASVCWQPQKNGSVGDRLHVSKKKSFYFKCGDSPLQCMSCFLLQSSWN